MSTPAPPLATGMVPAINFSPVKFVLTVGRSGLVVVPINVSHYKCDTSKVVVKFKNNAL